jgi:hypothetical protein
MPVTCQDTSTRGFERMTKRLPLTFCQTTAWAPQPFRPSKVSW